MMKKAIATPPGVPTLHVEDTDNRTQPPISESDLAAVQLRDSDKQMARVVEDIYHVLTADQRAALPQSVHDKIERRKALRAKL